MDHAVKFVSRNLSIQSNFIEFRDSWIFTYFKAERAISGVTRGMKVQATWHHTWGQLALEWVSAKLLECMMLVVGAWLGMGDTCHDLSHVSSLMQTCLGLVEKHGRDQAKGRSSSYC